MEGEWRLGCPVEHHKQGVHSNIKDLNGALKEVQIAQKRTEEFQQIYKKVPKELCKKIKCASSMDLLKARTVRLGHNQHILWTSSKKI